MSKLQQAKASHQAQIKRVIITLLIALCVGCATTKHKDTNKNLFEQALVLQQVNSTAQVNDNRRHSKSDEINWQFSPAQIAPNKAQKQALFNWFAQIENYTDNPVLLQLGPDWISSYKRGNVLRNMVPRGIVIEQRYVADMTPHQVHFSFNKADDNKAESKLRGGLYDSSQ